MEASLRIFKELPKLGACLVSTSWGKDSVVLADLALAAWGSSEFLHLPTSYELPGNDALCADLLARGGRLHELRTRSLKEVMGWLEEVGLPHERTRSQQTAAVTALKKSPATTWALDRGYAVMVLGLRAAENQRTRGLSLRMRGHTYQLKSGIWISNPLASWTGADIWAYIFSRGLTYNRLYDAETHGLTRETIRNTGWLSTDGSSTRGRAAWLRHHFPDQWIALCRDFPEMTSYV